MADDTHVTFPSDCHVLSLLPQSHKEADESPLCPPPSHHSKTCCILGTPKIAMAQLTEWQPRQ